MRPQTGSDNPRVLASIPFVAQLLTRGFQLAALTADTTRPGILPEGVNHGAADAALGKGLELDATGFIEAVRRIDQADDAVLNEVADINRMRHGGRDPASELLDERDAGKNSRVVGTWVRTHQCDPPFSI